MWAEFVVGFLLCSKRVLFFFLFLFLFLKSKLLQCQSRSEGSAPLSQPQIEVIHDFVLPANHNAKQMKVDGAKRGENMPIYLSIQTRS